MDEVDNIIIHSLRQIGCKIDDDVISLSSFSPELLVETVSKCLKLIKPSLTLPDTLPPGMAQRFSVTATLAEACTSIGFKGDIGYQTFLYSNVTEVRRVFMFLIEHLPKETEKLPIVQPLDKLTQLENDVCRNIRLQLSSAWIPQYCNKFGVRKYDSNTLTLNSNSIRFRPQLNLNVPNSLENQSEIIPELHNYWLKRSSNIFQQTNSQTICPSVIHKNDIEYFNENLTQCQTFDQILNTVIERRNPNSIKNISISNNTQNLDKSTKNIIKNNETMIIENNSNAINSNTNQQNLNSGTKVIENFTKKPQNLVDELNEYLENLKSSIKELLTARKDIQLEIQKFNDIRLQNENSIQIAKDQKKIKERTFILLENPDENLAKMETLITASHDRMKKLREQWEDHRKPLAEKLEKIKSKSDSNLVRRLDKKEISENKVVLDEIKITREKISEMTEELKNKIGIHSQLQNEFKKIDKKSKISRSAYTTRILEIIGNIKKQNNDIEKILRDTRELQKQINTIQGQLDRQFTVTDDLLYKTAKRDEDSKKAYKLLAQLHSDCSILVTLVQEIGLIMREIRDLEDQIEREKSKNILTNLEKITFDLKQMEKESKELQDKIRQIENQIIEG